MSSHPLAVAPAFAAYVVAFGAAAVVCFASARRTAWVDDPDTRRGLRALLLASGGWASAHVVVFLAPWPRLELAAYVAGLVTGLGAVGAWLYFCSAYSARTVHRDAPVRRLALAVFLVIVLVKVTNPLHGLYFTTARAANPFPHLAIRHGLAHWLVVGLSYGLSVVGYFMLAERFADAGQGTRPLVALVGLTALPVGADVVGYATPYLVDISHEPLGVAAFAVGVNAAFRTRFQSVQVTAGREEPVVLLDADDRVREYNERAAALFPALGGGDVLGASLSAVLPDVAAARGAEPPVVERDGEATRYYRLAETPVAVGRGGGGTLLAFEDVTERERYRRQLERQVTRLERFAGIVSHDLRDPLNTARAKVRLARRECDSEKLAELADVHDRMERLIEDVLTLTKQGRAIGETAPVALAPVVEAAWSTVDAPPEADLRVAPDLPTLAADEERLQALLENLFRNAIRHAGPEVTVRVGPLGGGGDGFYVEDDGPGIPASDRETVFEYGHTTADGGTGLGLAIVDTIAEAHGWQVTLSDGDGGGARFEVGPPETRAE